MSIGADYAGKAKNALAQIKAKGGRFVLKQIVKNFDPLTSQTSDATVVEGTIDAVMLTVGQSAWREFDDSLQEALRKGRLRKLLIAAASASFEPQPSDIVVIGSDVWTVRVNKTLNPDGVTSILHTVIVELGAITQVDEDAFAINIDDLEEAVDGLQAAVDDFHVMVHETMPVNFN